MSKLKEAIELCEARIGNKFTNKGFIQDYKTALAALRTMEWMTKPMLTEHKIILELQKQILAKFQEFLKT